ncbi:MAG TPA: hypothetical protein VH234_06035 [Candidatus Saccharimonadales bacterium]|jgi:hypothetical protein|nr:hypothetical protein [Candidatus Saccharimonadales bacterium]
MIGCEQQASQALPEQDPTTKAVAAIKRNTGLLLSGIFKNPNIDKGRWGDGYLSLRLISKDGSTGLSKGLRLRANGSYEKASGEPAYSDDSGKFPVAYGSNSISCTFIEAFSSDNFNVQELRWNAEGHGMPLLTEEGIANAAVSTIIGGYRGDQARYHQARLFGVEPEDFVLFDGFADANRVNALFGQIFAASLVDNFQPT